MNAFIKSKIKAKVKPLMPESAYNYFVKWFDDFQVVAAPGVRFYKGVKFTPLLEAAFDEIAFQEEGDEIVYKACTDPKKLKIIKVPSPDGWITFKRVEDEGCEKCKGTGEYTDNGLDYLTCDCVVGCPPDYVAVRHDMKTIQKAYNDITLRKIEEVAPTPSEQRQWTLYDFAQKLQQEDK